MEFKTKQSSTFIMNIFMIALALAMAIFCFLYSGFRFKILQYSFILWLALAWVRWSIYKKYIYLMLKDKPVLSVNENFIHDFVKDIKYNWEDIEEIYEDNGYLLIKLYNPTEYFSKIKSPIRRLMAKISFGGDISRIPFVINVDMIKVDPNALLEILNDYSLEA